MMITHGDTEVQTRPFLSMISMISMMDGHDGSVLLWLMTTYAHPSSFTPPGWLSMHRAPSMTTFNKLGQHDVK
jgi:hypothetical protein